MSHRIVVVSPHLDDAAFSCGTMISAAALSSTVVIVTVCDGEEPRRLEDIGACAILGASHIHLGYPEGVQCAQIKTALDETILKGDVVFGPVGIRHPDHIETAAACEGLAHYRYEELPYRVLWPEHMPHPHKAPVLELPASAARMAAARVFHSYIGDGPPGEALWAGERYHLTGVPFPR